MEHVPYREVKANEYRTVTLPTGGQLWVRMHRGLDPNGPVGPTTSRSYFLRRISGKSSHVELHKNGRVMDVLVDDMSAILGPVFDDWWNQ